MTDKIPLMTSDASPAMREGMQGIFDAIAKKFGRKEAYLAQAFLNLLGAQRLLEQHAPPSLIGNIKPFHDAMMDSAAKAADCEQADVIRAASELNRATSLFLLSLPEMQDSPGGIIRIKGVADKADSERGEEKDDA